MDVQSVVYTKSSVRCNGHHEPFSITGRWIAHASLNASERAAVGAQLVLSEAQLVRPTATQVGAILHVSAPYLGLALKLAPETRDRVAMGELSLTDAAKGNGLVTAWLVATPDERCALGRAVGIDAIWDASIEPSL